MSLSGDNLTTLTPSGDFEYAPTITPDGTGLVVGRRDASGADLGYWRYPLVSGADTKQVAPDGAPGLGSVTLGADGLAGQPGMSSWTPRAAFTSDGTTMLVVRGSDNALELVDMTGATKPISLGLQANSRPVWVQSEDAFYLAASNDKGATWACWQVTSAGLVNKVGAGMGDIATNGKGLALLVKASDGSSHLAYWALPGGSQTPVSERPAYDETAPSFSPDGSVVVFGRVGAQSPACLGGHLDRQDRRYRSDESVDGWRPAALAAVAIAGRPAGSFVAGCAPRSRTPSALAAVLAGASTSARRPGDRATRRMSGRPVHYVAGCAPRSRTPRCARCGARRRLGPGSAARRSSHAADERPAGSLRCRLRSSLTHRLGGPNVPAGRAQRPRLGGPPCIFEGLSAV